MNGEGSACDAALWGMLRGEVLPARQCLEGFVLGWESVPEER